MKLRIKEKLSNVFNTLSGNRGGTAAVSDKPDVAPLARAYAHSDCKQKRPLFEALDNGFCAIEADVWLHNGKLLVGHDLKHLKPELSLEKLYLKPLEDRARKNNGHINPQSAQSLMLLIDIKSEPESTYKALHKLLEKYKGILTVFVDDVPRESAVTAVISGYRSWTLMKSQNVRYAASDGRLGNWNDSSSPSFMPMISGRWRDYFKWNGKGVMPAAERKKLRDIVDAVHSNGRRIRFWDTPERDPAARDAVWKELVAAKVDYINTDQFSALRNWLLSNDPQPLVPEIKWLIPPPSKRRGTKTNMAFLARIGCVRTAEVL